MTVSGTFNVTESGAATYSIPIPVPPGTAGMVPSLSLDYNSHGSNGLLGMGWALTGLPSIGRCARTQAHDGVRGVVNYDMNDRFCMEGQRLILISGTYGAAESEYRTEIDGFSKITAKGTAGDGPTWFEVKTKSGQTMEFGKTTDSRFLAQGKTTARSWGVNKISDAVGNYLTVTYQNDSATSGEAYPLRIDYTGNDAASLAAYNSVQFVWEEVWPRPQRYYHAGSYSEQSSILRTLKTFESSNLISQYKLNYDYQGVDLASPVGGTYRWRLSSIDLCDGADICLPKTEFGWTAAPSGTVSMPIGAPPAAHGAIMGDFNGDGRSDIFFCHYDTYPRCNNPAAAAMWLSNGDGTFDKVASDGVPIAYGKPFVGDFNGDSLTDIFFCNHDAYHRCKSGYYYLSLSNGDGTFTKVALPSGPAHSFPFLGDFNGDGRIDIFFCTGDGYRRCQATPATIWLSNGDGTFSSIAGAVILVAGSGVIPGDFDGDGQTDLFICSRDQQQRCHGTEGHLLFSNGDGTFSGMVTQNLPFTRSLPYLFDGNGDGKTDILFCSGASASKCVDTVIPSIATLWTSKGDGTFHEVNVFTPVNSSGIGLNAHIRYLQIGGIGDFNGDGRAGFFYCEKDAYNRCTQSRTLISVSTLFSLKPEPIEYPSMLIDSGSLPANALTSYAGDFSGDGRTDLFLCHTDQYGRCSGTQSYLWNFGSQQTPSPDLLSSFTTGLGLRTEITYRPLTDGDVYAKDEDAVYPVVDVQTPMFVVSRVDADDGVGGTYSSEYSYGGAKVDLTGRGFLGFRQHVAKDLGTDITQTTDFLQIFPYTGLKSAQTKVLGSQVLNELTNTWISTSLGDGKRWRVLLEQTIDKSWDLDGSAIPPVTTKYTYDDYSNPTQIEISTPDGVSKTTVNTFANDTTSWWLGRLIRTEVTSTMP